MKHPIPARCRVHHAQAALWYCDSCRLPLCPSCKPYAEELPLEVDCPLCGQAMAERRNDIEDGPALRTGLKHSIQLPALGVAACVALIASLGFHFLPGLLLTLPIGALLLSLMIAVATRAGEGHQSPPTLRALFDIDLIEHCLRILPFGLPFAAILIVATASGSTVLAIVAWLATATLLPAALMAALIAESPGAGLNPASIARIIRVTKQSYARVALLSAGAVGVVAGAMSVTGGEATPLLAALAFFATLLALGLSGWTGTIMRNHRRMLEYPAGVPPIDRPRRPEPAVYEPALLAADARTLLHEKRTHEARVQLGQALTRFPDDPELNEQFDSLVSATARPREVRNHLERRMHRLIRSGQVAAATELWQRNSPRLDNWIPRVSETRYRLALELDDMGEHQTAFRLLIGLPPEDRKFAHIADAWMEAARILEQRLDDPKRAAELRRLVHDRYPEQARKWGERWLQSGRPELAEATPTAASAHG